MTDQQARDAALGTGSHVLLQAPAGSGKTTVLAQRFLAALSEVEEPEEVLAITFTRKAAAEMRERVLVALEDQLPAAHPDRDRWSALRAAVLRQAAARGWNLDELPARLRIQTIDSLGHEIARAMPLLGRLHQMLGVIDNAAPSYQAAAEESLRLADSDPQFQADADLLLQRLDNDWNRAVQLLAELLPGRNRWLSILVNCPPELLAARVTESLVRIARAAMQELQQDLSLPLLQQGLELARAAARNLRPEQGERVDADLSLWQDMGRLALTRDGSWRRTVTVREGFPREQRPLKQSWEQWRAAAEARPGVQQRLRNVLQLPPPGVDAQEAAALAALARLMLLAAAQLKLVFRDQGHVDHSEIAAVARQALRDMGTPTELSIRQTLRVRHLLVDEFQDTSPDQLDLVRDLTQGWDDGLRRSLFLVGDPMQSIYLFRNSEVGLFLQVRAQGVGDIRLQALQLARNFRSVPELVAWSNGAFSRIFPMVEDVRSSAVTFLHAEAARPVPMAAEPAVTIWPQPTADSVAEARQIATEIARLRQDAPALRIAILLQTRTLAAPVLGALRRAGIPVLGVELASLAERPVVRDLIAIGRALRHGGDRSAWLMLLRAPCCGLTLHDLHALGAADPEAPLLEQLDAARWDALSSDGRQRLQRVAPLLLAAWRARGSMDLATAIEALWRQLGGWFACRDAGERNAALQFLAAVRRGVEEGNALDGEALQRLAEQLRDQGSASGEHPVEVLTIHHAKGLEWDVVFVPGLGRVGRADSAPLLRWLELPTPSGDNDLLLAVRSIGEASASDPLGRFIAGLQNERQDNERVRLAYVAVTRARQRLYLSGHAPWSAQQAAPVPAARSLLRVLWPAVRQQFEAAGAPAAEVRSAPAGREVLDAPWYRLAADFQPPLHEALLQSPQFADSTVEATTAPEFSWVGPLARAAGTVMHAELEAFARHGIPAAAQLSTRAVAYAARLLEHGVDVAQAHTTAAAIVHQLQQALADPQLQWLLDAGHAAARCEWRLSGVVDGALRNVVIDRSFVVAGERWVIDYKTSTHAGGGMEEFLQQELARYAPQLRLYRQLASRVGPEPVRVALYFPLLAALRELDVSGNIS